MQKELQRIDIEFEGIDYVVSVPKQKGQYMKMKSLKYTCTMRESIFEFVISHGNANEIENAKFSKKIENPFAYHQPNWFRSFVASE